MTAAGGVGGEGADPPVLRRLAESIAEEAAALLLDGLPRVRRSIETKSSATDVVTEMDRQSEALVVERLRASRPGDGILGEEGADQPSSSGIRWVVDPLDGTTNYLYRLPGFGVSIAAQRRVPGSDGDRWQAIAGSVVDVVRGTTFSAAIGHGATCDGTPIAVSGADEVARSLVATGFSYDSGRRAAQATVLAEVLPRVRDIRRTGAAAVDLCLVAAGQVDAFYEKGLAVWDHAAGGLIASEAGAVVGDLHGGTAGTGFVLAATPAVFEPLRDLLVSAGADHA